MDIVDGDMRKDQAGAARRADHDGVFRVGKRGEHIAKRHGLGTSGTERVLFDEFLRGADIFPPPVFLAIGGMVDEVLIVQRHDVVQIRRYGDAFLAHVVSFRSPIVPLGWQLYECLYCDRYATTSAPDMHTKKNARAPEP